MHESLKITLRNQTLQSGEIDVSSSSSAESFHSRQHPYSSLYSCCYSLLILINVLTHHEASSCDSKLLSQLCNHHDPVLRLHLSFLMGGLLLNLNKVVEHELLIMGDQQLIDIFSIIHMDLCTWLNVLGLGAKNVNAKQHNQDMVSQRLTNFNVCSLYCCRFSASHLNLHGKTSWDRHPILLSKWIHDFCKALGSLNCITIQIVQNIYASLLHLNNFYNSVIIFLILRLFIFIWIAFIMFTGHYTELCSHFLPFLHCRMAEKGENLPNLSNKNYISKQVACL